MHDKRDRETVLQVRLTHPERDSFQLAAEFAGISQSAWVRQVLRRAAVSELRAAGMKVPLVEAMVRSNG